MATFTEPVKRRKNGGLTAHYWARIYDGGRRTWKSTGQTTLKLAKEVVRTWRLADAKGERHSEDIDLSGAADRWLEKKGIKVSASCLAVYRTYAGFWKRHFKRKRLRSVTAEDIEAYLKKRKKTGITPRSLNNERVQLRSFFELAKTRRWIVDNPMATVDKFLEPKRRVRVPSQGEEKKLLEAAHEIDDGTYGFVLTLMCSGLRRGTVAALAWEDIDFAREEWRIPARKMKSREDFTGRPIVPELLEYLRERRRPAGLVFGHLDGKRFARAATVAGLSWLKPHDLRRSFVSRCRRAAVPLEVTMWLSDHRDVNTVMASYREVDSRDARKALQQIEASKAGRA